MDINEKMKTIIKQAPNKYQTNINNPPTELRRNENAGKIMGNHTFSPFIQPFPSSFQTLWPNMGKCIPFDSGGFGRDAISCFQYDPKTVQHLLGDGIRVVGIVSPWSSLDLQYCSR